MVCFTEPSFHLRLQWKSSRFFSCTKRVNVPTNGSTESWNIFGVVMSNKWNDYLMLMCFKLQVLWQKPGKQGKMDCWVNSFLIIILFSRVSYLYGLFMLDNIDLIMKEASVTLFDSLILLIFVVVLWKCVHCTLTLACMTLWCLVSPCGLGIFIKERRGKVMS